MINGEESAFTDLVRLYQSRLGGFLYQFSRSFDLAETWNQDTWVKVWRHGAKLKYQSIAQFESWLFTVARRVAIDGLREFERHSALIERVEMESRYAEPDYNRGGLLQDGARILSICVGDCKLARKCQKFCKLLEMKYCMSLTDQEMAEVLGLPLGSISFLLKRCLSSAREALQKLESL